MASPIEQAIRQICEEKGLSYEAVVESIEAALGAAYRKDFGDKTQNIEVEFDPETAGSKIYDVKTVVDDISEEALLKTEEDRVRKTEERNAQVAELKAKGEGIPIELEGPVEVEGPTFNPKMEIMISEAKKIKKDAEIGEVMRIALEQPGDFGRMAAMTAKQVITQKLREAEREVIFSEFKEQEHAVINAVVQRREGRVVLVDIGRTTGVMRPEDQIPTERYNTGDRIKVYVKQVSLTTKGPEILVSRTAEELVSAMFEVEVPEISEGLVAIKGVAREAGSRTKVAVATNDESIDPIGACIGQRGSRIQTIITELGGEKIDVVEWNKDNAKFIMNSLSPAKITQIKLDEAQHMAYVSVPAEQLSLAIGKGGQNVRLASRLTSWRININEMGDVSVEGEKLEADGEEAVEEKKTGEETVS